MTAKQTAPDTQWEVTQWEVVSEPRSTIIFTDLGDEWEGFYEGPSVIHNDKTDEDYDYLSFRDSAGDPYQTSAGYDLKRAFESIAVGTYVKIILTETKPSSKGNDVKLFKVLTRK